MELEAEAEGRGLKCSCVVEHMNDYGQVLRKQACKDARLDLGRNEVEDVVLKLSNSNGVQGPFTIREHSVLKRFLKDGKATIILKSQKIQLLISNCPPFHLRGFLQSLSVKLAARGKIQGSHRRMLGDISKKFNEISPITAKDIEMARKIGNKTTPQKGSKLQGGGQGKENAMLTPHRQKPSKRIPQKRKLSEMSSSSSPTKSSNPNPCRTSVTTNPAKKPALLSNTGTSGTMPLSAEQAKILELVKNGESVFFTGSAGTGKSHLLKRIIRSLPPDTTYATASTGVAACLVGGTTLHAFAGMGTGGGSQEDCIAMASRDPHASTWRQCRCLVIDEISMVDAEFFDKMEGVARVVRKSRAPFGGIQLVVCGDFLQLPPVAKDGNGKRYCFQV